MNADLTAAPVLILIHGATMNGRMWDPVRRHLAPGRRVLAPDLPGHGSRRGERFTLEAAVATVVEAARSVEDSPVILAGDSLGGYAALAAASALPRDQLRELLVGGCTGNIEGLAMLSHFIPKTLLFKTLLALMGEEKLIASLSGKVRAMLAEAGVAVEDAEAIIGTGLSASVFEQAVAALRGVDFRSMLAAIEQPVLLLNGDRDRVMTRQEAEFLAAARQGSVQRWNCEHGVSLLRSREFAALLEAAAARASLADNRHLAAPALTR
ncbi:alpha/beta hydrolase [Pelomonas sp. SE-A7]|uniref:alpha/beta fold hydrolase n=1 Tax=Pelomonas sp. SE-A7 TaxID=3054953 RepID=UPI00259D0DD2|nr:alpha/beta hydrolase [Pelomonas sp. SE-A7]MDM4766307.1 alpha/beta hydrolase [Pelomonas sp. SE-A7]